MTKVAITGRFATTTDVVRVHRISPARQAWLEKQLGKVESHHRNGAKKAAGAKFVRVTSDATSAGLAAAKPKRSTKKR